MSDSTLGSHSSSTERDTNDDSANSAAKEVSAFQSRSSNLSVKYSGVGNIGNDSAGRSESTPHATGSQDEYGAGDLTSMTKAAIQERSLILGEVGGSGSSFSTIAKGKREWNDEVKTENVNAPPSVSLDHVVATSSNLSDRQERCISLRAWLNDPARVIDHIENLYIFKQIAEFVELAHSQGVVLRNVRPSSFLLSSLSRISIIESASSRTSSNSSAESNGGDAATSLANMEPSHLREVMHMREKTGSIHPVGFESGRKSGSAVPTGTQKESSGPGSGSEDNVEHCFQTGRKEPDADNDEGGKSLSSSSSEGANNHPKVERFPLKEILSMEIAWYKSPEEMAGMTPEFSSDIYNLGVLLVELFYSAGSQGEWSRAMSDLRHRFLPPSFLLNFSKEASFSLLLLHPVPECRPKAREILHADIFGGIDDKLAEREAIVRLEEKLSEAGATLEFLLHMQQKKRLLIQKVVQELSSLNGDIEDVKRWQIMLLKNSWNEGFENKGLMSVESSNTGAGGVRDLADSAPASGNDNVIVHKLEGIRARRPELLHAKPPQLSKSFTELREFYLSMINISQSSQLRSANDVLKQSRTRPDEHMEKTGASRFPSGVGGKSKRKSAGRLGSFFDDFCHFMKYSKFHVKSTLQYGDILNTKNMVCSLSFDCDDEYFATAGVSKRIKIFDCNALLESDNDVHFPVVEMSSIKKLSCVCWNKFRKNILSSSDLEGVVQVWDVKTGQTLLELKEHSKCAWSVDFSHFDSSRMASGSDDCCVKLWSIHQATSIGTIKTKANICSVQFSPHHSHILAFGSADSQVYIHDLRYIRIPVSILTGHQKAVSFVRFVDSSSIVSASTDNTLKLWDTSTTNAITKGSKSGLGSKVDCAVTYTGHTNLKNFVGLSVTDAGYIACGSETDEVYVYHKSLPMPMLSHKFRSADPISGEDLEDFGDHRFVSSVCWQNKSLVLVIANSVGNIQVLEMV